MVVGFGTKQLESLGEQKCDQIIQMAISKDKN
jgi:hypothetical protein